MEWGEVTRRAAERGLAALSGFSPDVGATGYLLGGGIGWLVRRHGLGAGSVQAVEIVTADGQVRRVDREHDPELFWALRGGGGNFGVVTALEIALYPAREVYAGMLLWPWERGGEVLRAWRDWIATVPDEVTSVSRFVQVPPLPDVPEPLRGRAFVGVEAVYIGAEADGAALLTPLRALGPEMDTFGMLPPSALGALHMDPQGPTPGITGQQLLTGDLSDDLIDTFVAVAGPGSNSPLVSVELRQLGGALRRPDPDGGAVNALAADFLMFAVGIPVNPEVGAAIAAHCQRVKQALAPWDAGKAFLNFAEHPIDARAGYPDDVYERLRAVKAHYDPDNLIRANHAIMPA